VSTADTPQGDGQKVLIAASSSSPPSYDTSRQSDYPRTCSSSCPKRRHSETSRSKHTSAGFKQLRKSTSLPTGSLVPRSDHRHHVHRSLAILGSAVTTARIFKVNSTITRPRHKVLRRKQIRFAIPYKKLAHISDCILSHYMHRTSSYNGSLVTSHQR